MICSIGQCIALCHNQPQPNTMSSDEMLSLPGLVPEKNNAKIYIMIAAECRIVLCAIEQETLRNSLTLLTLIVMQF